MSDNLPSLPEFIERHGLTMTAEVAETNPHMANMPEGSTHWLVTLRLGDRSMIVPYSMGSAHSGEPEIADVLSCLTSDAGGIEGSYSFSDWCGNYGYDDDSRTAERVYNASRTQTEDLKLLVGDAYHALLYETEPH